MKAPGLLFLALYGKVPSLDGAYVVTDFGNCSQLLKLSLSSNVLTGGIPREFDKLRHLERLYLAQNHLSLMVAILEQHWTVMDSVLAVSM
jgi:hypothetical protein